VTVVAQVPNVAHTWASEWLKDSNGSIDPIVNIVTLTTEWLIRAHESTETDVTLTKRSAESPHDGSVSPRPR